MIIKMISMTEIHMKAKAASDPDEFIFCVGQCQLDLIESLYQMINDSELPEEDDYRLVLEDDFITLMNSGDIELVKYNINDYKPLDGDTPEEEKLPFDTSDWWN